MAIPAYLWLKDDGGVDIKGAVDVQDRDGSIEIKGFSHNLSIPTDGMTGKITETRKHSDVDKGRDRLCETLGFLSGLW